MNQNNGKRALVSLVISIAIAIPNVSIPASAVTFGSLVPDPANDAPYVVSIWTSENNDSRNAEFTCTGTLIAPQIVLTAAHCTTDVGSYFVKVKSQALNDKTPFISVSGVWTSPRYDARNFTNDIGLLKLDETFTDIEFPSLANSLAEKSVNKFSKLRIYGWGRDQDKKLADLLRTADLLLQDSTAAKTFGKSFNKKTMISAGKRIVAEKVWSGACNGDSGGPLITKINDINVIVGITSWGAANCIAGKPSIFARVSYYLNDIKSGIKAVQTQSEVVNRTAPIAVVDPSIQGEAVPGRNLTCFKGEWKNAVSVQMTWLSPARLLGSTKPEITVLASDGGSEFRCSIDAFSKNASVKRNLTKSIIGKASVVSKPAISGLQPGAIVKPGMTARCEGWNWQTPVDSERVEWFTSSTASPSTPVNGRTLGQGATLSLTSENIRGERGRYLVCQVTGIKDGFESHFTSSLVLNTAVAPSLSYASISGYSLSEGSSVTCQFSSLGDIDETRIEWGTPAGSNSINPFPGVQGASISINRSIIQQGAGRNLACKVTVINSGGEAVRVATSNSSFESAPTAPSISTYLFGTPVVGSSASCTANSAGATISYQWGLTRTAGARSFEGSILGTSSTYTITSGSFEQLAGSFLTCVATATNNAGTSQSASSISIPSNTTTIPRPTAPIIETQIASSTSISVKIRVPSISGFDGSKMVAKLNVVSAPNCTNLTVNPGSTYDCAGLSASATYTANVSVSSSTGQLVTNTSPNVSFTTIGLGSLQTPIAPTFTPISPTEVSVALPGIAGFNPKTMSAQLYIYYQTSLSALGIDGSASTVVVKELASGKTHTGYIVLRSLTDGSEVRSVVVTFTLPTSLTLNPTFSSVTPTSDGFTFQITNYSSNYNWQASISPIIDMERVNISISGLVTVTDLIPGSSATVTIRTSRIGSSDTGSASITGSSVALLPALIPTFSAVTSNSTGFTFQITNYNPNYQWQVFFSDRPPGVTSSSTVTVNSTGFVTVAGISGGTSATIKVGNGRTGYATGASFKTGSSLGVGNELKIIATGPDSDGITNIGICFTIPAALSGNVTYDISGVSSGSFLKHSGTPACPSFASGSTGLRLSPDTSYNYSATASNNGINYSATLSHRTPTATILPGLTPSFGARVADTYSGGFKYQITNYDPSYTWAVTATSGSASISSSGLLSVVRVPAKQSSTLTVTTRKPGYNSGSASITSVSPWDLSAEIQTQNITATLSGTALTVNVPDAKGWTWTLIWDGYVQRTGITSFPYVVNGFSTNKNIQLAASDNLQNYGYSRVFLPTVAAPTAVTPEVIFNSGNFTSGVVGGSISPGGSFGISWRVINTDQIASTVALIDSNGNSASWVGGALVSGTVQDGTYQGSLSVPANFAVGRYLICAIAISSTNKRSASQCGSRSEYVQVAELQVNTAPIIPSKYSGTDAYSGIVSPGRGQFWESGFQNAVSVSVVASSPGEASIVAPFSNSWGGTVVIAVADGMSVGQKLYKAAIYVPVGTPQNKLFTLTWTATSATGHTLVVTEGSFNTGP